METLSYDEILELLHTADAIPLPVWEHICGRIQYDAASSVPGAVRMLSILRSRVMSGETVTVADKDIRFTRETFDETIEGYFGEWIRDALL